MVTFFREQFMAKYGTLICFTPDDQSMATCIGDTIHVKRHGSAQLNLEGHSQDIRTIAVSQDGTLLASGDDSGTVIIWSLSNGKALHTMQEHSIVDAVSFSTTGFLATCGCDATKVWKLEVGRKFWQRPSCTLVKTLAANSAGFNSAINVQQHALAFSPQGTALAIGEFGSIGIWSTATWTLTHSLSVGFSTPHCVAFSHSGYSLAAGADEDLYLWQTSDYHLLSRLRAHEGRTNGVTFSFDEKHILSCGEDKRFTIWRVHDGSVVKSVQEDHRFFSIAITRDNRVIAVRHDKANAGTYDGLELIGRG